MPSHRAPVLGTPLSTAATNSPTAAERLLASPSSRGLARGSALCRGRAAVSSLSQPVPCPSSSSRWQRVHGRGQRRGPQLQRLSPCPSPGATEQEAMGSLPHFFRQETIIPQLLFCCRAGSTFNPRSLPPALRGEPGLGNGSGAAGQPLLSGAPPAHYQGFCSPGITEALPAPLPLCPSTNAVVQLLLEGTTRLEGGAAGPALPARHRVAALPLPCDQGGWRQSRIFLPRYRAQASAERGRR